MGRRFMPDQREGKKKNEFLRKGRLENLLGRQPCERRREPESRGLDVRGGASSLDYRIALKARRGNGGPPSYASLITGGEELEGTLHNLRSSDMRKKVGPPRLT